MSSPPRMRILSRQENSPRRRFLLALQHATLSYCGIADATAPFEVRIWLASRLLRRGRSQVLISKGGRVGSGALYTIHENLSNILLRCLSRFPLLATRRHAMFTALFPIPMAFRISPTEQNNAAAPRADRHSRGILRDTSRLLQCAVVVPCFHCIISVRCCQ